MPSEQVEALRESGPSARGHPHLDRMCDRHRVTKFLLRHGLRMPNKSWLESLQVGYLLRPLGRDLLKEQYG